MTIPPEPLTTDERLADLALTERAAERARIRWQALEQRIVRLRGDHLTLDDIAERTGQPRSVVALTLRKRGIP